MISRTLRARRNGTFQGVVALFRAPGQNLTGRQFLAQILWNDGSAPTFGVVRSNGRGLFTVSGSHRFRRQGTFPVIVVISDGRGAQGFALSTAVVPRRVTTSLAGRVAR